MLPIRVIIFDFDGVIVESVDIKTEAFRSLFAQYPQELPQIIQYHQDHGGISRMEKFKYIYREILRLPLTDAMFDQLCGRFADIVTEKVIQSPYVAGAWEFLQQHHQDFMCHVMSGTPHDEINTIVDARGLRPYFHEVWGSPLTKIEGIKQLMKYSQVTASQTVVVGDAMTDFLGAKANKTHFIGRVTASDPDVFEAHEVDATIADLHQLSVAINHLNQ